MRCVYRVCDWDAAYQLASSIRVLPGYLELEDDIRWYRLDSGCFVARLMRVRYGGARVHTVRLRRVQLLRESG